VKEDEMGGACSTNGKEQKRVQIIGGEARRKGTSRKTQNIGGWIILINDLICTQETFPAILYSSIMLIGIMR
jgi:hypothetical protein